MRNYLLISVLVLLSSCGPVTSPESDLNGTGRIIFGQSIDGVELGDTASVVIEKLGEPDEIALGDFAGVTYYYYEHDLPSNPLRRPDQLGQKSSSAPRYVLLYLGYCRRIADDPLNLREKSLPRTFRLAAIGQYCAWPSASPICADRDNCVCCV